MNGLQLVGLVVFLSEIHFVQFSDLNLNNGREIQFLDFVTSPVSASFAISV